MWGERTNIYGELEMIMACYKVFSWYLHISTRELKPVLSNLKMEEEGL